MAFGCWMAAQSAVIPPSLQPNIENLSSNYNYDYNYNHNTNYNGHSSPTLKTFCLKILVRLGTLVHSSYNIVPAQH